MIPNRTVFSEHASFHCGVVLGRSRSLREEKGQGSGVRESWRSELQQLWQSCAGLAVLQDMNRLSTGRTVGSQDGDSSTGRTLGSQDGDSRCYQPGLKSISSISCAPIASTWFFSLFLFFFFILFFGRGL